MADQYETRRLLRREVAGIQQIALRESIELKYQIRLLFKLLGKQDEAVRDVCDHDAWVMQQFAEMLNVPKYALIKICPLRDEHEEDSKDEKEEDEEEDCPFNPLIYEEKVYSEYGEDIRVMNCNDDSLITTLTSHTNYIQCLIIEDGKLYSGSKDCTIKIWNCNTDTLIKTLTGHTGSVYCLTINDGKLFSGGGGYGDNSIKVWNLHNHKLIATLGVPDDAADEDGYEGHTALVKCLTINDGKLYSGSWDKTIKVWDCGTNKLIITLKDQEGAVHLFVHDGKLYSKSIEDGIKVYDCNNHTLITALEDSRGVACVKLMFHDDKLYTGSNDSNIRVYDCRDDSLITTLRGHTCCVKDLTIHNGKLYSKQCDGTIYIWQL